MGAEPDYTVILLQDRGHGAVRQIRVSRWQIRLGLAAAAAAALLLAGGWLAALLAVPSVAEERRLAAENLWMQEQIAASGRKVQDIQGLVERLQRYDLQIRQLESRGRLSAGPIDAEEAAARLEAERGDGPDGIGALTGGWAELDRTLGALDAEEMAAGLERSLERLRREELRDGPPGAGGLPEIWPVDGRITSRFGWRIFPFTGRWAFHGGLDLGAPSGQPIYATSAGLVVFSDWNSGHGQMVVVDHGGGVQTRYCHASELLVMPGDSVQTGDTVALVGSTGLSTGPHLHYDLIIDGERVDPLDYLPVQ